MNLVKRFDSMFCGTKLNPGVNRDKVEPVELICFDKDGVRFLALKNSLYQVNLAEDPEQNQESYVRSITLMIEELQSYVKHLQEEK